MPLWPRRTVGPTSSVPSVNRSESQFQAETHSLGPEVAFVEGARRPRRSHERAVAGADRELRRVDDRIDLLPGPGHPADPQQRIAGGDLQTARHLQADAEPQLRDERQFVLVMATAVAPQGVQA